MEQSEGVIDSKKMLKNLAEEKRVVKLNDRKKLIVLKDFSFYKKGQEIEPHVTWAEQLIKDKVAKAV